MDDNYIVNVISIHLKKSMIITYLPCMQYSNYRKINGCPTTDNQVTISVVRPSFWLPVLEQ